MGKYVFNPIAGEFQLAGEGGDTAELQAAVEELQQAVFQFEISSFTSSIPATLEYTGAPYATVLRFTCRYKSQVVTPDSYSIALNGVSIGAAPEVKIADLGTTTITLTAKYKGMTATKSLTHNLILPIFVGFGNGAYGLEELYAQGHLRKEIAVSLNKAFTLTNKDTNNYLYIALPQGKGVAEVKSGGFDVPMVGGGLSPGYSITIAGVTYNYSVFLSANPINTGEHTFNIKTT